MKVAYISAVENPDHSGVYKKIRAQIKGLEEAGINVILLENEELPRWKKAIPFSSRSFNWKEIKIPEEAFAIYIRYQLSDFPFIRAIRKWKKEKPERAIILEIPMFPYINELEEISNKLTLIRDRFYSRYIHKYVDRIVTFTSHEEVLGVKTISMVNGIEVEKIVAKKNVDNNTIDIIAVALVNFSHGYDRLIAGLAEYYKSPGKKYNVIFHLVGDGDVVPKLKQMVIDNQMDDHVIFYGFKSGLELDALYDRADIGVDVLGGHRKGDVWFGTLKSREYLSKGLPFITEYELPKELEPVKKFIYKVSNDESAVNIEDVIKFYNSYEKDNVVKEMRGFAKAYCDVSVVMQPLIKFLKGTEQ